MKNLQLKGLYGSLAAAAIAVYKGAHIIRTHDVPETFDVVKLSGALRSRPSVVKEGRYEVSVLEVKTPQDAGHGNAETWSYQDRLTGNAEQKHPSYAEDS